MLPIPRPTAIAAFVSTLIALSIGAMSGSLPATVLGVAQMIGLAIALAATIPLGRRVRRQKLEFAWWLGHGDPGTGGGAVVPGAPFEVRCFVRHRGTAPLLLREMTPIAPGGATRASDDDADSLVAAPIARTEFTFRLVAPAVGRVVLHGLAVTLEGPLGLFAVPLYFPNPLAIKVLPQAAARVPQVARTVTGSPVERSGTSLRAPQIGGTELRELREMRPGDPYKSIAWKASARRGKLLVREVDQEVQETRYVVLDVSGTMRGGEIGKRKLDFVIEAVAAEARRAIANGDRFGLVTVDGRVLAHPMPRDGSSQLLRVFDALIAATEVVDQDLTDADDEEVVAIVGRYVRQQDGVDFSTGRDWNVTGLVRHVQRAMSEAEVKDEPVIASSPALGLLRRFCRVRGIPLPYRPDPQGGTKGPGIATVLREIGGRHRSPISLALVTDLDGLGDPEPFVAAIKYLRLRGHAVVVVAPDATTFAPAPTTPLERELFDVYARGERRRAGDMRALLAPLGVRVVAVSAGEPAAFVLARAEGRGARRAA